jgi:hypothetical protein
MLETFGTWLVGAVLGYLVSLLKDWLASKQAAKKSQDKGAADQRNVDAAAEKTAVSEMEKRRAGLDALTDTELRERARGLHH